MRNARGWLVSKGWGTGSRPGMFSLTFCCLLHPKRRDAKACEDAVMPPFGGRNSAVHWVEVLVTMPVAPSMPAAIAAGVAQA
jgi:hypothetical protein